MANAKKCDRCDTLFETYGRDNGKSTMNGLVEASYTETSGSYSAMKYVDLCPNCLRSYLKWRDEARRIQAMCSDFTGPDSTIVVEEDE